MKKVTYTIQDSLGIHARPAGMLVKKAASYTCAVTLRNGEKSADAKRVFALMGLGVKCGDTIEISCDGSDEDIAIKAVEEFLKENL